MKANLHVFILAALAVLGSAGCNELADELLGGPHRGANGGDENGSEGLPAELQCTEGPTGRSYALFDGTKLEESRQNEAAGVNRARIKPYPTLEREYKRVLGVVPPSLKDAAGSFDVPPARWYGEAEYSAVSLHAAASIAYEACLAYTKANDAFAEEPTDESARAECSKLMRKAWSRSPSPDEIGACADLAVKTLSDEKDVRRRWAYACASVLSSTQFLTF